MAGSTVTALSSVRRSPRPSSPNIRSCCTINAGCFTTRMLDTKWPCQNQRIHSSNGRGVVAMATSHAPMVAAISFLLVPPLAAGS